MRERLLKKIEDAAGSLARCLNPGSEVESDLLSQEVIELYRWRNGYDSGNIDSDIGTRSFPPMQFFADFEFASYRFELHQIPQRKIGGYAMSELFPIFAGEIETFSIVKQGDSRNGQFLCYFIGQQDEAYIFSDLNSYFEMWIELIDSAIILPRKDQSEWAVAFDCENEFQSAFEKFSSEKITD